MSRGIQNRRIQRFTSTLCYDSFLHFSVTANQNVQNYLSLVKSVQRVRRIIRTGLFF
jgi:hypothetical protein